jgi:hypothetical protein
MTGPSQIDRHAAVPSLGQAQPRRSECISAPPTG